MENAKMGTLGKSGVADTTNLEIWKDFCLWMEGKNTFTCFLRSRYGNITHNFIQYLKDNPDVIQNLKIDSSYHNSRITFNLLTINCEVTVDKIEFDGDTNYKFFVNDISVQHFTRRTKKLFDLLYSKLPQQNGQQG